MPGPLLCSGHTAVSRTKVAPSWSAHPSGDRVWESLEALSIPRRLEMVPVFLYGLDQHFFKYIYIYIFFFNDTATTEIYTLSLHDALPICQCRGHGFEPWSGKIPHASGSTKPVRHN